VTRTQSEPAEIGGGSAAEIADSVERAIRERALAPGDALPTVRALAERLGVSPATVASAYRTLRSRGLVVAAGRRGTTVSPRPPIALPPLPALPSGILDLATGNPDPLLLPDLAPFLARIAPRRVLYGEAPYDAELLALAERRLRRHGLPTHDLAVVGGALDGVERVLAAWLRPGDRVAVEDPGFSGVLDLLGALGLVPVPVAIDDEGPLPDSLEEVLRTGPAALVITPRAQNPSGAALSEGRARDLRRRLDRYPDVLLVEDDHAGDAAGTPPLSLVNGRRTRWAAVHSVSKTLGPDLRLAVLASDAATLARVEGRQLLGIRWVSHILQRLVVLLWKDREVTRAVQQAGRIYTQRRQALLTELARHGVEGHGRSGLHVWVRVPEEATAVGALRDAGCAVAAGERFRLESPPAIRVTTARLPVEDAASVADAVASVIAPRRRTRLA